MQREGDFRNIKISGAARISSGTNNYEDSYLNTDFLFICLSKTHLFLIFFILFASREAVLTKDHIVMPSESLGSAPKESPPSVSHSMKSPNGPSVLDAKAQSRIPW